MAYRTSAPDLDRPGERTERWDRDRFSYEKDRDRYGDVRERFEEDDDHVYTRRGAAPRAPPPRERSVGDYLERRRGPPSSFDDDDVIFRERERRRVQYDDEPPRMMRRRPSPPEVQYERTIEKERRYRSPSPARRPGRPGGMVRRPSSLDTFDRKPMRQPYYERDEAYGPPARKEDFRAPPYVPIPLPRSRALPPPRVSEQRDFYEEIQVSDQARYGDEAFHGLPEERVREKRTVRTRRRSRSRESRATRSYRSSSRASSTSSSSSSSSGGTTITTRSEYPKKGKTRVPERLVSRRALIDLGYPFVEEGSTIVIQKALGQKNIDDLLKLSDEYKKSELEIMAARSSAGDIIEERRTEIVQVAHQPTPVIPTYTRTAPVMMQEQPRPVIVAAQHRPPTPVEVVQKTAVIRDVSPSRYTTSSYTTDTYSTTSYDTSTTATPYPVMYETAGRAREVSGEIPVGPVALATDDRRRSHHDADIRHEIRHLERELARRDHSRHRGELVKAERLSTGELVLFEESVERVEEPSRGVRIEKDKKGPPPRLMKAMLATLT
ncbi:hypothetical protein B0H66DRAFT_534747 [Apodospora peruviana]|uniref:DUF8035 domain-containing protein n=1 Tax=Apodospora peruviana TaxID=516989 RepID=A0AAE0I1P7_9PEZI|nr:hypothetical protein B0H66DRAFT_534747 [Apodospora peruviana]